MPLITERLQNFPDWCELRHFSIVRHNPGEIATFTFSSDMKRFFIVGRGSVIVDGQEHGEGSIIPADAASIVMTFGPDGATVIQLRGRWGEETGGLGIFGVCEVDDPQDRGDPVSYSKATAFDAHYHDCDEYWIIFEGEGVAVSEGIAYDVAPGDCVATGMGHHHDFPQASETVRAVFFETTLQGEQRRGHLWNHTHGPAQPQPDRT
jgi:mannose-6-phosphate isomerase-like protein (cupin superfamily)